MNLRVFNLGKISENRGEIYGLSIIWIMFLHGVILDNVNFPDSLGWLDCILSHGNVGVDIFLFLSGMGLYFSYTRNNRIREYTIKRLARVLVPYILIAVPAYFFIDIWYRGGEVSRFFLEVTQIGFWTKGYHLTWYVAAILLCYFLYPYIYAFLYDATEGRKNQSRAIIIRVIIFCVAWAVLMYCFMLANESNYEHMEVALNRIPIFVIGCAFGKPVFEKKTIPAGWIIISFPVIVGCFFIIRYARITVYEQRYIYLFLSIFLILAFSWIFDKIKVVWIHKILKWFGNYSLELYLIHICIRDVFMKTHYCQVHVLRRWGMIMIASVLIAAVIGKIVEIISQYILVKTGVKHAKS